MQLVGHIYRFLQLCNYNLLGGSHYLGRYLMHACKPILCSLSLHRMPLCILCLYHPLVGDPSPLSSELPEYKDKIVSVLSDSEETKEYHVYRLIFFT